MTDTTTHLHILNDTQYQEYLELRDSPIVHTGYRTTYRLKTLMLYPHQDVGEDMLFGHVTVKSDDIDSLGDKEWDLLIQEIDQVFLPLPIEDAGTLLDPMADNDDHVVTLRFNKDNPFIDTKLEQTVLRIYPDIFTTEAEAGLKSAQIKYPNQFGEEDLKFFIISKPK